MRNPKRIKKIIKVLKKKWKKHPELRLGQLFCWLSSGHDLFNIEDEIILKRLTKK